MNTIELNKIYTIDNFTTYEFIKKTSKFITYRSGYLRKVENGIYNDKYRYEIYGSKDMETRSKLFVEDDGNEIYIKLYNSCRYFKTDKPFRIYRIFDDNKIIERKFI